MISFVTKMKYDVSKLFKIETNEGFQWVELPKSSEAARSAVLSAAKDYGVSGCRMLLSMDKRNKLSSLYRLQTEGQDYVLRAVSESEARLVEEQCRVAHEVNYPHMIKPNPSRRGGCVTVTHGCAWISYGYHEGELFSGEPAEALEIIEECFKLIHELKKVNGKYELFRVRHEQNEWVRRLRPFLDSERFNKTLYGRLLSEYTQTLLSENKQEIKTFMEELSTIDLDGEPALTHNDLNHANIVVQKGRPFFLDLEDICFENVRISIVHCIFKLLRHTVYAGKTPPEEVRGRLLPLVLKSRTLGGLGIRGGEQFYALGKYRILSDINLILERISRDPNASVASDLEKKFMNLFELHFLANTT